jgi:ParB family chromosome partitioning protein
MPQTVSRKELKALADDELYAPLVPRQLLSGLGEVVHRKVPVAAIHPNPDQPRSVVDEASEEFEDLVGSIRAHGLIQPISLWQVDEENGERYTIIAGERRWRAFKRLAAEDPNAYASIPATITVLAGTQPQVKALMMGLVENVVREDLKPTDRADSVQRLRDWTGWTYDELAQRLGVAKARVLELVALIRDDDVRQAVELDMLGTKQAVVIAQGLKSEPELIPSMIAAATGKTLAETRDLVRSAREEDPVVSPALRVERAVARANGQPSVGSAPVQRRHVAPIRQGDEVVGRIETDYIVLANTALSALRSRRSEVSREEAAAMIQLFCEQTNIWPTPPDLDAE